MLFILVVHVPQNVDSSRGKQNSYNLAQLLTINWRIASVIRFKSHPPHVMALACCSSVAVDNWREETCNDSTSTIPCVLQGAAIELARDQ